MQSKQVDVKEPQELRHLIRKLKTEEGREFARKLISARRPGRRVSEKEWKSAAMKRFASREQALEKAEEYKKKGWPVGYSRIMTLLGENKKVAECAEECRRDGLRVKSAEISLLIRDKPAAIARGKEAEKLGLFTEVVRIAGLLNDTGWKKAATEVAEMQKAAMRAIFRSPSRRTSSP